MDFNEFLRWEEADRDVIKVKRLYVDIAEDLIAGILLSQIVYWYLPSKKNGNTKLRVKKDNELWLAKGRDDWWDECRITPKQFDRAINILSEKGIIEKELFRFNGSPTVHIRLIPDALMGYINSVIDEKEQGIGKWIFTKGENGTLPKGKMELDKRGKSLTETTTKITAKTTTEETNAANAADVCSAKQNDKTFETKNNIYTSEFEQFWDNYPRKLEKKAAFKAWNARIKQDKDIPEMMIQAAKNYAEYCNMQHLEQRFIKHASTFLGPNRPFDEFINGIPEQINNRISQKEPKSWETLRTLYQKYQSEEAET